MKKSPLYKLIVISLAGILILWIIQAILFGVGMGVGFRGYGHHFGGGMYMGNGMYMGSGFAYGGITYLFIILIKILFALFIIGLIVALAIWVKNSIFTEKDKETIKNIFTGIKANKEVCSNCGKEIEAEWKVCPYCGKEKKVFGDK